MARHEEKAETHLHKILTLELHTIYFIQPDQRQKPMRTDEFVEHLSFVLPLELMAVQQHFIHVLILRAWGKPELAQGIVAIDEIDLPNAMRITDLLVSLGKTPVLGDQFKSQYDQMPAPGNTYESIFSSERSIEAKLITSMSAVQESLEQKRIPVKYRNLIKVPLSYRSGYEEWMKSCELAGLPENDKQVPLSSAQMEKLNLYFAHLVLTINQEMIHSFVHWHNNEEALADASWAASGGAMMQATALVNLLAKRRLAPSPINGLNRKKLLYQNIGENSEEALNFSRDQAVACQFAAERSLQVLCETEFEAPCQKGADYFDKMRTWRPGNSLPKITNPCLDFKRLLRLYVWEGNGNSKVIA